MIIFYFSDSKRIINQYPGFDVVTVSDNRVYINNTLILNQNDEISWKYITDQILERDVDGNYLHDADYYEEFSPLPSDTDRIAAIEQYLLEQELGL